MLAGIAAARRAGFTMRLNAVAIRGMTEPEIVPLAEFARIGRLELRFIEFMPLDAAGLAAGPDPHRRTSSLATRAVLRSLAARGTE